eukprot:m.111660 g.111660  ORF g.111660 m.111660 type:complete len:706 (-) comp9377_c0_seq7:1526-3643(-)
MPPIQCVCTSRIPAAMSQARAKVESRSPAEFFAEHKSIAGFDNPGKSLYTTVREFVENSLDAAEELGRLPEIQVHIELVPALAVSNLYGQEAAPAETTAPDAAETPAKPAAERKSKSRKYYRVTVRDNGCGMPHDEIPRMLGIVLSGTKYNLRQARGRFGLGAKMALIWAKMTTERPLEIYTARPRSSTISHCTLDLNIHKNEPNIIVHEKLPNDGSVDGFPADFSGTEISVVIEGNWSGGAGQSYQWKILRYMRLLAVITPYAEFLMMYDDPMSEKNRLRIKYSRRTDIMPPVPKTVKHHPSSVDLVVASELRRLALERKTPDLLRFLTTSFSNITRASALEFIETLGNKFDPDMSVEEIDKPRMKHLVHKLNDGDWPNPSGEALSPAGAYNMYLGVMKELNPDMIATHEEPPHVFQGCFSPAVHTRLSSSVTTGHAFIIEAAVSIGGKSVKQGISVFRFANRIPLLFEAGSDVIYRTAQELKWNTYKMSKTDDKIGVFVSMVSTKIPFKGTNKEFISDEIPQIKEAIRSALQKCCAQLKTKIARKKAFEQHRDRKRGLTKYIPDATGAIFNVLSRMVEEGVTEAPPAAKKPRGNDTAPAPEPRNADEPIMTADEVLAGVHSGDVVLQTLRTRLAKHVDQYDASAALEYVTRLGRDAKPEKLFVPQAEPCPVVTSTHPWGSMQLLPALCINPQGSASEPTPMET